MKLDLSIEPLTTWAPKKNYPLLIAGPCSAETEEQLIATARLIAKIPQVAVFRAGVWKPRTRPGDFEGIGSPALKWLKNVKSETKLLTAVEVASARHVEEALLAEIDILWIGARSTTNPFTVQDIANALKGVDMPIMIKNPISPDLSLWIGALERINHAGITKIAAVHRGFSWYEKTNFRNEPMWELAIQLKTMCPHLPIINDPSHISGNKTLIPEIAQRAIDLDMQGLMLETHIDPKNAWTDALQQLDPDQLAQLIDNITLRTSHSNDQLFAQKIIELRNKIDQIDDQIIQKIAERMQIAEHIGTYKRAKNITILQVNRWDQIINQRNKLAQALKLDTHFTTKLLELIHGESIRKQTEIMNLKEHQ